MSTIGELNVKITADSSNYLRQLNEVQSQTNRVMNTVKKTVGTALAVAGIYKFSKSCIQLGSDLAEVQNVVDTVFTSMSDSVNKFSKGAISSFGLSETVAKKYIGTFGAMANAFGFTEQEAYNMSTTLAGLAGDVASFYNITSDEAYTKLKSVFSGETETLKDLGVVMTQNALDQYALANGYNATTKAMSEQEKVALRYNFVLDQLSLAQGDFARTSDSWSNQVRVLTLRFEQFKATIGQGLINIFLPIIKVLNVVISKLQVFAEYFSAITEALFGKAVKSATKVSNTLGNSLGSVGSSGVDASNGLNKTSKATKGIGKEAKKTKKELNGLLGGLDEINNLTSKASQGLDGSGSSGGVGGIGGIGGVGGAGIGDIGNIELGGGIDTSKLEGKVEKIKSIFSNLRNWLSKHKDKIISVVAGLVAGVGSYFVMSKWGVITKVVSKALSPVTKGINTLKDTFVACKKFGITPVLKTFFGINPIFIGIATAIGVVVGSLVYLWRSNEDFRKNVIRSWKAIQKALGPWLESFKELFLLLAEIVGTVLVGAFKVLSKVVVKVVKFLADRLLKRIQKYCPHIESLGEAFLGVVKALRNLWDKVKEFNFVGWIKDFASSTSEKVKEVINKFGDLKTGISEKWEETKDTCKDFVINISSKVESFKDKASEAWENTKTWSKDKVLSISSKVASIYDKAKTAYNTAKDKIKSWALSIGSKVASFYAKAKEGYNAAKEKIKAWAFSVGAKVGSFYDKVRSAYNSAKSKIKTWAFNIGLKVETSANNVKNTINGIIRQINNAVLGKIKFTVPDWIPILGGKTWKAPTIPYLAKGGIVDSATLAMIGEAGKEAVVPLENNTGGLDLLASKLQTRMATSGANYVGLNSGNSNGGNGETYNGDVVIKLDGNTVFKQSMVSILRQMKRQGITI